MRSPFTRKLRTGVLGAAALLAAAIPLAAKAQGMDGKALFTKNCAACHLANGKGIPGAFPALAGNAFVSGPVAEVATVLLKGRGGMPDFSNSLGDDDITLILNYVRSSWGNKGALLAGPDVAATRDALGIPKPSGSRLANKH